MSVPESIILRVDGKLDAINSQSLQCIPNSADWEKTELGEHFSLSQELTSGRMSPMWADMRVLWTPCTSPPICESHW